MMYCGGQPLRLLLCINLFCLFFSLFARFFKLHQIFKKLFIFAISLVRAFYQIEDLCETHVFFQTSGYFVGSSIVFARK